MKTKAHLPEPELSRPIAVDKIAAGGIEETIIADADERKKLVERFGLLDLTVLKGTLDIKHSPAVKGFVVTGRMEADVVQQCVVTLDPLPGHVEYEINTLFAPESDVGEEVPVEEGEIETILDGVIDLGELVAQTLGIALDPYPRKPGADFVQAEYGSKAPTAGPLAKLADWKKTKE